MKKRKKTEGKPTPVRNCGSYGAFVLLGRMFLLVSVFFSARPRLLAGAWSVVMCLRVVVLGLFSWTFVTLVDI